MQEGIVAACLSGAFIYILYVFYRKIRRKGGGCCGCDGGCSGSTAQKCPSQRLHEINTLRSQDKK